MKKIIGLAAAAVVCALCAAPAQAVVINPANLDGWAFLDDISPATPATGELVYGPGGAGQVGLGSARLTTSGSSDGQILGRAHPVATFAAVAGKQRLTTLNYRTYRIAAGAANAPSLQLNVDYDVTDANNSWQGRLVYEPYNAVGAVLTLNQWQTWSVLGAGSTGARFWATGGPGAATCPQSTPCSMATLLAAHPRAGIHPTLGGVLFKVGSGWSDPFDGRVDNLNVNLTGTTLNQNFDFEPERCTTDCYVDAATGSDANSGTSPATATKTIQAAISRVDAGGTVHIGPGTYNEDVALNKANTLLSGAGADQTTIVGQPGGSSANTVALSGAGSVLENVTVTRAGNTAAEWNGPPGLNSQGVIMTGAGSKLRDSRITGNRNGVYTNQQNVIITRNEIDSNRTGIQLVNNVTGAQVTKNAITDNWTIGLLFRDELNPFPIPDPPTRVFNPTGLVTVEDNDISGNWYSQVEARSMFSAPNLDADANWLGSAAAPTVVSQDDSGEPAYADQIPAFFPGGDATAPLTAPTIVWDPDNASNPLDFDPWRCDGTDSAPGTIGFQPTGALATTVYADGDGDGFGAGPALTGCADSGLVTVDGDADDADGTVFPGATELCDGKDNDQDGDVDEGVTTRYYEDADGDGLGNPSSFVDECSQPAGYVTNDDDADDTHDDRYVLSAFGAPIKAGVNSAKGGQSIPVKVRVTDVDGNPVSTDPGLTLNGDDVEWAANGDGWFQTSWKTSKSLSGPQTLTVDINQVTDAATAQFLFK